MKELFLLRGLPGSGKSTLAKSLGGKNYEADMFFERGLMTYIRLMPLNYQMHIDGVKVES